MMKYFGGAVAACVLVIAVTMSVPAEAGPILDAMKKAQSARGIAIEGTVLLKHKLRQKAQNARGFAREGSLVAKCKVESSEVEVLNRDLAHAVHKDPPRTVGQRLP